MARDIACGTASGTLWTLGTGPTRRRGRRPAACGRRPQACEDSLSNVASNATTVGSMSGIKAGRKAPEITLTTSTKPPSTSAASRSRPTTPPSTPAPARPPTPAPSPAAATSAPPRLATAPVSNETFEVEATGEAGNAATVQCGPGVRGAPPPQTQRPPGARSPLWAAKAGAARRKGDAFLRRPGRVWSAWEPCATTKTRRLTKGKGTKTVHVEFRAGAGMRLFAAGHGLHPQQALRQEPSRRAGRTGPPSRYILSGASTPSKPSPIPSTSLVAAHSARRRLRVSSFSVKT